jgi:hypothetical protein
MGKGVRVRNTTVNGGMTGRDETISKVFQHKEGQSFSTMKRFNPAGNPNTAAQQLVRNTFAQTSAGWSGLTEGQRNLWNSAAPDWATTGIFGSKQQSGKNLYTGCNVALVMASLLQILEPRDKNAVTTVSDVAETLSTTAFSLSIAMGTPSSEEAIQVCVSPQLSAGTSKNDKYVVLYSNYADESAVLDLKAAYEARFGTLIAGKKIFYKVNVVSSGGNVIRVGSFVGTV